jgi:predicted transcriptional regulator
VVERRKVGRAYKYVAQLSADDARAQALGQVVANFFGGSKEAMIAHLARPMRAATTTADAAVVLADEAAV